ncbi:XylR [Sulfobacillus acidophilus TPY]|uniref:N-acylmannosamine kinase n=1 Tax=Sulfobacillus acidophilus (strain ATCC 700253 / DSM 10332 / NAL) TaxID=679936 RepID=G8TTI7_SULAD|nr:XylR [Sulfobacillus acidophilus TPY]AEW05653.1 N-acylmannosamine kinase [Sulfobacillus acidophilus DSM 10332]
MQFSRVLSSQEIIGLITYTLRNYPNLSRAELATMLPVTPATLTHHVRELIDGGWVEEQSARRNNTGGRPRMGLTLRNEAAYAIAMTVSPDLLTGAIVDFGGHIIAKMRLEHPMGQIPSSLQVIQRMTDVLLERYPHQSGRFAGYGIAIPGIWDPESETVVFSPNLQEWAGMKLRELIRRSTDTEPTLVENDADAAAWGELWFGAGRDVQDMMYVLCDTGIGAGIIIQRQLIRGQNNSIGEIGHIFVDSSDSEFLCGCGQYGCLEALGSLTALQRYHAGGMTLSSSLGRVSRYLSIGLGGLINVLSPQVVVLGGRMLAMYPDLWPAIVRDTRSRLLNHLTHKTQLILSPLEDNAPLLGLAGLLFEQELARSQGQAIHTVSPSQWLTRHDPSP